MQLQILNTFAAWLRQYLPQVSLALVASLLVIYGTAITRIIRSYTQGFHFLVRLPIFVLVCAFGYGAVAIFFSQWIANALGKLGNLSLLAVIAGLLILVGILAEHKRQM